MLQNEINQHDNRCPALIELEQNKDLCHKIVHCTDFDPELFGSNELAAPQKGLRQKVANHIYDLVKKFQDILGCFSEAAINDRLAASLPDLTSPDEAL